MSPSPPAVALAVARHPIRDDGCALTLALPAPLRRAPTVCAPVFSRRLHSSARASPPSQPVPLYSEEALEQWIHEKKSLIVQDTLRPEHLADLYVTLPTRDGSREPWPDTGDFSDFDPPQCGEPLGYGHHLVFFHPRNPESELRVDGTDADFCPPEPFTRRMWAGGKMVWKRPLCVGDRAEAVASVVSVTKKGFETSLPMLFVKQKIEYWTRGEVCVEEERDHVYLAAAAGASRVTKEGESIVLPADGDG